MQIQNYLYQLLYSLNFIVAALFIFLLISSASFFVSLLFDAIFSIASKSFILCSIAFLAISLHLISLNVFIFLCSSSGIASVMFVIFKLVVSHIQTIKV